ncbi:imidazolonepropionase-like amidohydrolase [Evansella vedderi]|uniref:Imidazolonepropionase-like amidohydrolase n=1 Tax=Evansella vedderi TaxID=38282 RepID=A0ABT9ZUB3_9BACI|nr:amidohydrolase [Evansella vedderi]MDQ0254048.1 imidazolonepropionase-like amidohydrolase [Evansella vedderi]
MKAFINATVIDGNGQTFEKGTVIIDRNKVIAVGNGIDMPTEAEVIDCQGLFITPGLIDVHTHLGVHESGVGVEGRDFNETSDPTTPHIRALDGINPIEKGFHDARASGITTVQVMPGSANVIGGQMVVLKTHGHIVDDMLLRSPSGMKGAYGENPKRVYGEKKVSPITRMGIAAIMRQTFMKAQDYMAKKESGEVKERDLRLEQLLPVLKREIPFRTHAHRADDILTSLRLAREFDIEVTIEHCTEGHHIAERIAESGVQVSVGPTMSTRSKVELADKGYHTLVELEKYGVPFSITTDHPVIGIEYLTTAAANAVKFGLKEASAIKALTSQAARHIGVENRVGSLEKGKDADLVLWTRHPFDSYTHVVETIVNGETVYTQ